uniref:Alkaline ceramidase n=1 Tax=Myxobolus squamalis TaxID=59785 RepID=A0A6B2G5S0_MYXSQ
MIILLSIFFSYLNVFFKSKDYIAIFFGVVINISVLASIYTCRVEKISQKYLILGSLSFLIGFICWNIDTHFCATLREYRKAFPSISFLFQGHMWWHVLTATGGYFLLKHRQLILWY